MLLEMVGSWAHGTQFYNIYRTLSTNYQYARKQDADVLLQNLNTTAFLQQYKQDNSALNSAPGNEPTHTYDNALVLKYLTLQGISSK